MRADISPSAFDLDIGSVHSQELSLISLRQEKLYPFVFPAFFQKTGVHFSGKRSS
jgi:hypothetical protein